MTMTHAYRFGPFTLNLQRGCVQNGGVDLELRPKSFEVLRQLVENAGRLLLKDDLVRTVWPNVIVSDDSLAHCIRDIRKVLDDQYGQFIKTVPRRGYMFVADVDSFDADESRGRVAATRGERGVDAAKFEQSYRARLISRYRKDATYFVPLSGESSELANSGTSQRSADRRRRRAGPEYQEWLESGEHIKRVKLESLRDAVERYPTIILLGNPGCGKTSALENLAHELALEGPQLPVPLYLGTIGSNDPLEEFVTRNWARLAGSDSAGADEHTTLYRKYLQAGRLIFLFDALNEMPIELYRDHCVALREFIDRWTPAGNRFVVSCRVHDYSDELVGLQRVEIQPLSDEKIQQIIKTELPQKGPALWRALTEGGDQSRRLLDMARNPYLLTVMIDVFEEDGELIQNRAELMRQFTRILLAWTVDKAPAGRTISADVLDAALPVMAFEMQLRSGFGTAAMTEDVKVVLPRQVEVTPGWPALACPPEEVLAAACDASIVEMSTDGRKVRFYHQLLQEFFAAKQMLKSDPVRLSALWRWPRLESEIPRWVRPENNFEPLPGPPQTGWEETTIMAAGLAQTSDDPLIQTLCTINPVLAARCVLNARFAIEPSARQRVVNALLSLIADSAAALRSRIAAGEALGFLGDPRAGEMVTIPAGKFLMGEGRERHEVVLPEFQIGKFPVTNGEYARFVARRWVR